MNEFNFDIGEYIKTGLVRKDNRLNKPALVKAVGAVPYNKVLRAIESFSRIDTSALNTTFPYPQMFVLDDLILVCTADTIYEYDPTTQSLTKVRGYIKQGAIWDVVDYKQYVALCNGVVVVYRDSASGRYLLSKTLPIPRCMCDYGGQVLIGSPKENDGNIYIHNEGTVYVATGYLPGSTNNIMISSDGLNWSEVSSGYAVPLNGVAYSPVLGKYVTVDYSSGSSSVGALVSSDGTNWSTTNAPTTAWESVAWSDDWNRFYACAPHTVDQIMYSDDGANWTAMSAGTDVLPSYITYMDNVGVFLLGTDTIPVSEPTIYLLYPNHSVMSVSVGKEVHSVAHLQELGLSLALSVGSILYSTNGVDWTESSTPGPSILSWSSAAWSQRLGIVVAVSVNPQNLDGAIYSYDGKTWYAGNPASDASWKSVTWSHITNRFVAVGSGASQTTRIMVSSDGINWTNVTAPNNVSWAAVTWEY